MSFHPVCPGTLRHHPDQVEDLEAQRILLLLGGMEEIADVQGDETFDVGLGRGLGLEAAQTVEEDEDVAVAGEVFERPGPDVDDEVRILRVRGPGQAPLKAKDIVERCCLTPDRRLAA